MIFYEQIFWEMVFAVFFAVSVYVALGMATYIGLNSMPRVPEPCSLNPTVDVLLMFIHKKCSMDNSEFEIQVQNLIRKVFPDNLSLDKLGNLTRESFYARRVLMQQIHLFRRNIGPIDLVDQDQNPVNFTSKWESVSLKYVPLCLMINEKTVIENHVPMNLPQDYFKRAFPGNCTKKVYMNSHGEWTLEPSGSILDGKSDENFFEIQQKNFLEFLKNGKGKFLWRIKKGIEEKVNSSCSEWKKLIEATKQNEIIYYDPKIYNHTFCYCSSNVVFERKIINSSNLNHELANLEPLFFNIPFSKGFLSKLLDDMASNSSPMEFLALKNYSQNILDFDIKYLTGSKIELIKLNITEIDLKDVVDVLHQKQVLLFLKRFQKQNLATVFDKLKPKEAEDFMELLLNLNETQDLHATILDYMSLYFEGTKFKCRYTYRVICK